MRISPDKRRAARGVATVEVLVAVAIVMVVGTIGVLTFGNTDRAQVRNEAAELGLFLQQTRLRALEGGRPIEIILSGDEGVLQAGGHVFPFSDDIDIAPEAAQLVLAPAGGSDGLVMSLTKGTQSAQVTLDWLTGRVVVE
ncbi:pilus assembly FimT family protein [Yoonia sp. 2307UL14-13]|uniref:pilus assembly FimT family protein n=1 Tax=Yoonia sp. 2307UL14-13 TaxID=3126506 RepID=UPI0030A1DE5C